MGDSKRFEKDSALGVAQLMAASARTAPKTRGIDNIEITLIDDDASINKFAAKMNEISKRESRPSLERDANSIVDCHSIIIIGVKSSIAGLNCGFCGYSICDDMKKTKGICAYNSIDLGIAVGSALSIAAQFHIDNRVMYSIGAAALELKVFSADVKQALGIPLSVTGKNPFFDRK